MVGKRLIYLQLEEEWNFEPEMLEGDDLCPLMLPARTAVEYVWNCGLIRKEDILEVHIGVRWRIVWGETPKWRKKMDRKGIG